MYYTLVIRTCRSLHTQTCAHTHTHTGRQLECGTMKERRGCRRREGLGEIKVSHYSNQRRGKEPRAAPLVYLSAAFPLSLLPILLFRSVTLSLCCAPLRSARSLSRPLSRSLPRAVARTQITSPLLRHFSSPAPVAEACCRGEDRAAGKCFPTVHHPASSLISCQCYTFFLVPRRSVWPSTIRAANKGRRDRGSSSYEKTERGIKEERDGEREMERER